MTSQDLPNSVTEAQAQLHAAMGHPRWDLLPIEDSAASKTRRWGWWLLAAAAVFLIALVI